MLGLSEFRLAACLSFAIAAAHGAIVIDATKAAAPPQALPFATGGRSPDGHTLAINSRYLLLDGKPWFPVMGEFQYSRYPRRALGRRNPQDEGRRHPHRLHLHLLDSSRGNRGPVRLVRPPRPSPLRSTGRQTWNVCLGAVGPWDHGEVRNGGFPDWLLQKSTPRENDPAYLKYVRRFYGEIGRQLRRALLEGRRPDRRRADRKRVPLARTWKGEGHLLDAAANGARIGNRRARSTR